jgi:hypothetical protein
MATQKPLSQPKDRASKTLTQAARPPRIETATWHTGYLHPLALWEFLMYLRFAIGKKDGDSERALGVFHAVRHLRDAGTLHEYEEDPHDVGRWWFNENLERPKRFTAAKAPFFRKSNRALSWFKDTAVEHLAYVRDLVAILENHGVHVRTLKAKRVGYVVYEDEYQVVAEPFADMKC